jgi:hypothetical protein
MEQFDLAERALDEEARCTVGESMCVSVCVCVCVCVRAYVYAYGDWRGRERWVDAPVRSVLS